MIRYAIVCGLLYRKVGVVVGGGNVTLLGLLSRKKLSRGHALYLTASKRYDLIQRVSTSLLKRFRLGRSLQRFRRCRRSRKMFRFSLRSYSFSLFYQTVFLGGWSLVGVGREREGEGERVRRRESERE